MSQHLQQQQQQRNQNNHHNGHFNNNPHAHHQQQQQQQHERSHEQHLLSVASQSPQAAALHAAALASAAKNQQQFNSLMAAAMAGYSNQVAPTGGPTSRGGIISNQHAPIASSGAHFPYSAHHLAAAVASQQFSAMDAARAAFCSTNQDHHLLHTSPSSAGTGTGMGTGSSINNIKHELQSKHEQQKFSRHNSRSVSPANSHASSQSARALNRARSRSPSNSPSNSLRAGEENLLTNHENINHQQESCNMSDRNSPVSSVASTNDRESDFSEELAVVNRELSPLPALNQQNHHKSSKDQKEAKKNQRSQRKQQQDKSRLVDNCKQDKKSGITTTDSGKLELDLMSAPNKLSPTRPNSSQSGASDNSTDSANQNLNFAQQLHTSHQISDLSRPSLEDPLKQQLSSHGFSSIDHISAAMAAAAASQFASRQQQQQQHHHQQQLDMANAYHGMSPATLFALRQHLSHHSASSLHPHHLLNAFHSLASASASAASTASSSAASTVSSTGGASSQLAGSAAAAATAAANALYAANFPRTGLLPGATPAFRSASAVAGNVNQSAAVNQKLK